MDRMMFEHISPTQAAVEFFYGLLMAMTLSNTLRLALIGSSAGDVVFIVSVAIFGCNAAWGIADGAVSVLTSHFQNLYYYRKVKRIKDGSDQEAARKLAAEVLSEALTEIQEDILDDEARRRMADVAIQAIKRKEIVRPTLGRSQWIAAGWCVILNVAAALPFIAIYQLALFLDLNLVTLLANVSGAMMLFFLGRFLDRRLGDGSGRTGLVMVGLGMLMLAIIVALGG
ncbi:MAG TPA: hypothetical protein HA343_05855 [Methanomassiliicoccales archaeon]|nr:hypothetical protein [Methanomassiliicoccales archaeon]